jgi:hypothetical protein
MPNDAPNPKLSPPQKTLLSSIIIIVVGFLLLLILALSGDEVAAAPLADPLVWTCSTNSGQPCVCRTVFQRVGVTWQRATLCGPARQSRIAGLAAPLPRPVAGNLGGCGHNGRNLRYNIACTVTDAGQGFVSGTCDYGYWFSRVSTRRTFTLDQAVTVNGCEGLGSELYAPIRISR